MRAQADIRGKLCQGTDGEEWRAVGSRQHVITYEKDEEAETIIMWRSAMLPYLQGPARRPFDGARKLFRTYLIIQLFNPKGQSVSTRIMYISY